MKFLPLAKAIFLSAALLTTPSLLHAQDKKPGKRPEQAAEKAQPKFTGLWESPKEGIHLEFLPDGTLHLISYENLTAIGTWKEEKKNEKVRAKLKRDGEKIDSLMELEFDGEDKVTITVEGDPQSFVRVKGNLDADSFIGAWKSTEDDKEFGTLSHYITIMEKGGTGISKSIDYLHKQKIYYTAEHKFTWRIVGNRLLETFDAGTADEDITVMEVNFPSPEKARFAIAGVDEESWEEDRTEDQNLPKPLEGYKKVTEDEYWEAFEKMLDDE